MSSLLVKSLLWFLLTLVVCLTGSVITNELRNRFTPAGRDFFSRSISLQLSEARYAYETGGRPALKAYFERLASFIPGTHALLDPSGTDLITGANHSSELAQSRLPGHYFAIPIPFLQKRHSIQWPSQDKKYILLVGPPPQTGPWNPLPYYLWIAFATTVVYYVLAVKVAAPVRTLEQTVERFGRGQLDVRASMEKRRDEIGKLARAFNVMADRIETLLAAERRLLQDVSHELRSPLARLEFAVELARTSPDQSRAFDRIKKEVGRLSTLVSELLQVTRAESDPDSRNLDEISLRSLLQDVVEDCRLEGEARACKLVLRAGAAVPMRGDRELLRRAVENVLRNAIRYAPEKTAVEITVERLPESALISIRDYGPGVPEDSLVNLFKPFFRVEADRSRTDAGGGVGLGLSIAERAVAVHNGTIVAHNSNPGLLVEIDLPTAAVRSVVALA